MYRCEHCESVFEYFDRVRDPEVGWLNCCPHCGFDGVGVVYECEVCGEYADDTTYGACPECFARIQAKYNALIDEMTEAEYGVFVGILDEG